ncbi:MAG: hypothetical protein KAH10_04810 [Flavobacteriales bacterium]|nr:hypothetical protein [Flavobacteriales bacterium]
MKIRFFIITFIVALSNLNAQNVSTTQTDGDTTQLGLPGDNLDLYAVLNLFQESKTIEDFEKSLNNEKSGINNLDLNLDDKVDFIKVKTEQEGSDFAFVLQVDVLENETQDIAVILVSKNDDAKVTMQIVGDENLYGENYVIEPRLEVPAITANPAYSGPDTVVVVSQPATVVVVESEPIIQYVYSPVYVPYYPPYYYGYYPVYFVPYPVISFSFYSHHHRHHHHHYHGGGHNTVIIKNTNNYNNYNKTKNTSNIVNNNKSNGNYKSNNASIAPSNNNNNIKKHNSKNNSSNIKQNNKSAPSNKTNNTKSVNKPANKPASRPANRPSGNQNIRTTRRR